MPLRPDSTLGRLAVTTKTRPPLLTISVSPPLARFLIAAGARPHKEDPRTTLKQRIDLRTILTICNEALWTSKELENLLVSIQVAGDLPESEVFSMLNRAVQIYSFTNELHRLIKKGRFDDFDEARAFRWSARHAGMEAILLRWYARRANARRKPIYINYARITNQNFNVILNRVRQWSKCWLDAPPPNLRGIDLKDIRMTLVDVAGAIWDSETNWPNKVFAEMVKDQSDEISPNVYRVRLETEQYAYIF